ncbi:hypothetical protein [Candidatus Hamiltonella defensa]
MTDRIPLTVNEMNPFLPRIQRLNASDISHQSIHMSQSPRQTLC